eukprot:CAMPEP_0185570368 /NCGR_PEP_ID=MMETSP0434-20130131/2709_1 /TAXON_ID=626734 ORGANISM="Favella taraikaensis, Strain Fe Narragansett Bay" /NCGR_SAMPLE_ID=MMETSP0434 /ASSEMBLY_ACC=CAM_ASM_000379 /LENGTH=79 /DNA_ID=CAMNT_0028185475 /DNA_START=1750 /DNA_END=1989 /DNA_ORIENTATION=-
MSRQCSHQSGGGGYHHHHHAHQHSHGHQNSESVLGKRTSDDALHGAAGRLDAEQQLSNSATRMGAAGATYEASKRFRTQ